VLLLDALLFEHDVEPIGRKEQAPYSLNATLALFHVRLNIEPSFISSEIEIVPFGEFGVADGIW